MVPKSIPPAIILLCSSLAIAQDTPPTKNLDLVQQLASRIGKGLSSRIGPADTLLVTVQPQESAWYVVNSLRSGFKEAGIETRTDGRSEVSAEFFLHDLSIRYEGPRGDAVFGDRVVDRVARLSLDVTVIDKGETLISNERFNETMRDTIRMDDIERVETVLAPASVGTMESDGFFSTLLEPIVLIGCIGVAVFLLFHVRS